MLVAETGGELRAAVEIESGHRRSRTRSGTPLTWSDRFARARPSSRRAAHRRPSSRLVAWTGDAARLGAEAIEHAAA